MYSLIYNLYFYLKRKEKWIKEKEKQPSKMLDMLLSRIEWFYNVFVRKWYVKHPSKRSGIVKKSRQQKVVVSLTSYPKRIGTVWITIETLLRQNVKPDVIILWLAKSQFKIWKYCQRNCCCKWREGFQFDFVMICAVIRNILCNAGISGRFSYFS